VSNNIEEPKNENETDKTVQVLGAIIVALITWAFIGWQKNRKQRKN